jgi:hypothetical protein
MLIRPMEVFMNFRKILVISIVFVLAISVLTFAKTKKSDESRFQLGFGVMVSTSNLYGLIQNVQMSNNQYAGLTSEQVAALESLPETTKRSIYIANILGGMEYAVSMRLLWSALMIESDLVLLPFDNSTNGRLDFLVNANIGVRAPFWIMPYITAGPTFTFSWYPSNVKDVTVESWKSAWGSVGNFVWRPGLNARAGLDFKFRHFSIGAYYQYTIKDFQEFANMADYLVSNTTIKELPQAVGMVFASQSRFGLQLVWYLF